MRKRRRRRLCITLIVIALMLISGCIGYYVFSNNETVGQESAKVNTAKSDVSSNEGEEVNTTNEFTIQMELAEVEAKADELDNTDTSNMTQYDLNMLAGEKFTLWDDELNSIWERLIEVIPADEKDALVKEQQTWIDTKEKNSKVAGVDNGGGSLVPLLIDEKAADLTRVRVYYLAEKLATLQSESFEISDEIKSELDLLDYTLDDVLEDMEGQWIFDIDRGACIGIERSSESAYGQEDSEWTIWISGGDMYTEKDVYGYDGSCVVFHKANDDTSGYTVISKWNDSVTSWYGPSIEDLLYGANFDESITGY